jgi:hypothetical protein
VCGVGVAVAFGVAVDFGVALDFGVGVGVGDGFGVGVGLGLVDGFGVGVGLGLVDGGGVGAGTGLGGGCATGMGLTGSSTETGTVGDGEMSGGTAARPTFGWTDRGRSPVSDLLAPVSVLDPAGWLTAPR